MDLYTTVCPVTETQETYAPQPTEIVTQVTEVESSPSCSGDNCASQSAPAGTSPFPAESPVPQESAKTTTFAYTAPTKAAAYIPAAGINGTNAGTATTNSYTGYSKPSSSVVTATATRVIAFGWVFSAAALTAVVLAM